MPHDTGGNTHDVQRHWLNRIWPLVLSAILGGTGGVSIKEAVAPSRPDPFTGADAMALELNVRRDMERLENRVRRLEDWVGEIRSDLAHLPPDDLVRDVTKNAADIRAMRESIAPWVRLHPSPNDLMGPGRVR